MNKLPQIVVLISAVVAVVLFAVASWLDSTANPQQGKGSMPLPAFGKTRTDSALRTTAAASDCEQVEAKIRDLVDTSRACRSDADCVIFDYGYPIECLTSVARSSIVTLRRNFERYHASCEYRVYYDCAVEDANRQPICDEGQCRIELLTIESLKNDTLDYLRPDR